MLVDKTKRDQRRWTGVVVVVEERRHETSIVGRVLVVVVEERRHETSELVLVDDERRWPSTRWARRDDETRRASLDVSST